MNLSKFRSRLFTLAHRCHLAPHRVVVMMDGGVSSQIHQYILGYLYARRGVKVEFDMTFYEEWGSDLNRRFARNFDLEKVFPWLKVKAVKPVVLQHYRKYYFQPSNMWPVVTGDMSFLDHKGPLYLGNYYLTPPQPWVEAFRELFWVDTRVLDQPNRKLYDVIAGQQDTVAVHVRRGDLVVEVTVYGKPATNDYFARSVGLMRERLANPLFYFFSDEPDWVRDELIPLLGVDGHSHVVDINGSDKGYMDMLLMAACKHQITSKGTLGKHAAMLGDNSAKIVALCDDATEYIWRDRLHNPVFL